MHARYHPSCWIIRIRRRHSRPTFRHCVSQFFRIAREGPLGVTRILRPASFSLSFSLSLCLSLSPRNASLLSLQVDCIQETESAYYSYCDTRDMHPHKYAIREFRREKGRSAKGDECALVKVQRSKRSPLNVRDRECVLNLVFSFRKL